MLLQMAMLAERPEYLHAVVTGDTESVMQNVCATEMSGKQRESGEQYWAANDK